MTRRKLAPKSAQVNFLQRKIDILEWQLNQALRVIQRLQGGAWEVLDILPRNSIDTTEPALGPEDPGAVD